VGVVAWSDEPLAGRRLTAVPVRPLLADDGCRAVLARLDLGTVPEVEPVELAPFLLRPKPPGSPAALLRADAALLGFIGRGNELAFLEHWRDERTRQGPDVKTLLMTGRGGEGKTRLALEFLTRSKSAGWSGGLLRSKASLADVGVAAYAELDAANPSAHRQHYLVSLSLLSALLLEENRMDEAFPAALTAIKLGAELQDYMQTGAHKAITVLAEAYANDPRRAEAAFRKLTGRSLTQYLKSYRRTR